MTPAAGRAPAGLAPAFWRLLAASAAANLADGVFWVALPLLAVSVTDSPALVAGVTVAFRLPWLVFALVAGAIVDRVDRRRAMVVADAARVVLVLALGALVLGNGAAIWVLYLVAFGLGVLETVHDTASQTVVPVVVPDRDHLATANGRLFGAELLANQFVGPPVGGLLTGLGVALAFGATAAGYLGAALLLATLPGVFRAERAGPRVSMAREIGEGIGFLARHEVLRALAVVVGALNVAGGAVFGVLVLYVVSPGPMGLDAVGYGVLLTVLAAGTLAGTLAAGWTERHLGKANVVTAVILGMTVQGLVLGFTAAPVAVAAALFAGGLLMGSFSPVFVAFRQRVVPDRLLGRVVATFRVLGLGTLPVGALLGGLVGQALGLPAVFLLSAALCALLLPTRLVLTEAAMRRAEAAAEPRAVPPAPGGDPPG